MALLIVHVEGWANPTHNHQVIAVGYDLDETTHKVNIFLYDPTHPEEESVLNMDLQDPTSKIEQSTGETLRGFFVLNYRPRRRGLPEA